MQMRLLTCGYYNSFDPFQGLGEVGLGSNEIALPSGKKAEENQLIEFSVIKLYILKISLKSTKEQNSLFIRERKFQIFFFFFFFFFFLQ